MAMIERRDLPPPVETTIAEADRDKVYGFIAKRLADTLTGSQSYYPEGLQKGAVTQAADLDHFINSLNSMRQSVSDPLNILGSVIDELKEHAKDFHARIDQNSAPIELPPELSPTTRDNRVIEVYPFPDGHSPPNPLSPKNWPKDTYTSFDPSRDVNRTPSDAGPDDNSRLLSRNAGATGAGNASMQPIAPQQQTGAPLGLYSGRPMRQYIVPPPIYGRR